MTLALSNGPGLTSLSLLIPRRTRAVYGTRQLHLFGGPKCAKQCSRLQFPAGLKNEIQPRRRFDGLAGLGRHGLCTSIPAHVYYAVDQTATHSHFDSVSAPVITATSDISDDTFSSSEPDSGITGLEIPSPKARIRAILEEADAVSDLGKGVDENAQTLLTADVRGPSTLYSSEAIRKRLDAAVSELIESNTTEQPGKASPKLGQGTWEVFYAPHISRMSSVMGVQFDPIRYVLEGDVISSNVQYSAPLLGSGWLSAAGAFKPAGDEAVEVLFNSFWWDVGAQSLQPSPQLPGSAVQRAINALGRASFFPQLAVFPVLYVDSEYAVFQFTPLHSNIAVRRVL